VKPTWRQPMLRSLHALVEFNRRVRGGGSRRYRHLTDFIKHYKCRRIMEIGTWDGGRAEDMITAAGTCWSPEDVEYYGFDLWEWIDEDTVAAEFSKVPPTMAEVRSRLQKTNAKLTLIQGDTTQTLPATGPTLPRMDLIFIDGGHSYETVSSDWRYCQRLLHAKTVVLFDDHWSKADSGTDRVIAEIDRSRYHIELLEPADIFVKRWGVLRIRFVLVRLLQGDSQHEF
jgi:hypothetical protein